MTLLTRFLWSLLALLCRLMGRAAPAIDDPSPTLRLPRERRNTPCRQLLRSSGVTRISTRPPRAPNPWATIDSWWAPEQTQPSPTDPSPAPDWGTE
jgi:hypothetical protein